VGAVIVFLAKERIDECRDEHHDGHERDPYVDAAGEVGHEHRPVEERAAPQSEHHHVEHQLRGAIAFAAIEQGHDGSHQHHDKPGNGFGTVVHLIQEAGAVGSVRGMAQSGPHVVDDGP
jgi:hypothetical protein